jgi:small subunit ribosomal protein S20
MAITDSAKKAIRQSSRKRARNRDGKNNLKKILKDLKALVAQKKIEEAKKLLPQAFKYLDKAAKTGLIKKNTASRKKSNFSKLVAKQK